MIDESVRPFVEIDVTECLLPTDKDGLCIMYIRAIECGTDRRGV